jgi:hypothetical protein
MTITSYTLQHPYSSLRVETLRGFPRDVFIETGSNIGRGIRIALDAGFKKVYSVEENTNLFNLCRAQFVGDAHVHLRLGDSPSFLRSVVRSISERAVIYLDAHSVERNPLLAELKALEGAPIRDHILMIDDVRMFGTPDWHGLSMKQIVDAVLRINPGYHFSYRDTNHAAGDVMIAEVPE